MGAAASAALFQRIVDSTPAQSDQDHIEMVVHNNPRIPERTRGIVQGGPSPLPEIRRSVQILNNANVDFIVLACITAHYFVEELQAESRAQIIDGVTETVRHCQEVFSDLNQFGILASTGAISLELFQRRLSERGLQSVVLDSADQKRYFTEPIYEPWGVKAGHVKGKPTDRFLAGVDRLRELGAEAVIGGCSELALVFSDIKAPIPIIDSMDCLSWSAIRHCTESEQL